jgi:HK97 family phage prohead protease
VTERRVLHNLAIRAAEAAGHEHFVVVAPITPDVVDDYGSVWKPDTFDESLNQRLPVLGWAHDWSDPIGRGVEWSPSSKGPVIRFRFSDFGDVPQARRAWSQVKDGTISDVSVGFSRAPGGTRDPTQSESERMPGAKEIITRAGLDEVSLVLRGAVPGAKVLAVRSRSTIAEEDVMAIAHRVASGEWTHARGEAEIERLSTPSRARGAARRPISSSASREIDELVDATLRDLGL